MQQIGNTVRGGSLPAWVSEAGRYAAWGVRLPGRVVPVHAVHQLGSTQPLLVRSEAGATLELRLPSGHELDELFGEHLADIEARVLADEWSDAAASYVSPRAADPVQRPWQVGDYSSGWGIYVQAGAVEARATALYAALGLAAPDALGYALADLVEHELVHAALDLASLRLEGLDRLDEVVAGRPLLVERALCAAQTVRTARARVRAARTPVRRMQLEAARDVLEKRASLGPAGHRDWASVVDDGATRSAAIVEVLAHDGVPRHLGEALAVGVTHTQVPDVPLHLIVTPGTDADRGGWAAGL